MNFLKVALFLIASFWMIGCVNQKNAKIPVSFSGENHKDDLTIVANLGPNPDVLDKANRILTSNHIDFMNNNGIITVSSDQAGRAIAILKKDNIPLFGKHGKQ